MLYLILVLGFFYYRPVSHFFVLFSAGKFDAIKLDFVMVMPILVLDVWIHFTSVSFRLFYLIFLYNLFYLHLSSSSVVVI